MCPEHDLGAAAYAIKAARAAVPGDEAEQVRRRKCIWQRDQLPSQVRDPIINDQRRRNEICWFMFES
jgi:hypothetical protein